MNMQRFDELAKALMYAAGEACKPGETAARTGCTPASGEGSKKESAAKGEAAPVTRRGFGAITDPGAEPRPGATKTPKLGKREAMVDRRGWSADGGIQMPPSGFNSLRVMGKRVTREQLVNVRDALSGALDTPFSDEDLEFEAENLSQFVGQRGLENHPHRSELQQLSAVMSEYERTKMPAWAVGKPDVKRVGPDITVSPQNNPGVSVLGKSVPGATLSGVEMENVEREMSAFYRLFNGAL